MGKDREPNKIEKLKSETLRKECKTGEYTLSEDELPSDGQLIPAIKATHENGTSVFVSIDPSTEHPLKSFYVLTSDGGKFPCELDQEGKLSFSLKDKVPRPSLPDEVFWAAAQKLMTEKG